MKINVSKQKSGFTIIELTMATAVFSVVLLLGLTGFIQIGRMFYKGVTIAQTRDTATNILQTVSNDIRQAESVQPIDSTHLCIGNHRYSVAPGVMVSSGSPSVFGLKRETFNGQGQCMNLSITNPSSTSASPEMLQNRMRIASFNVSSIGPDLYRVNFKVVYGEDSELTSNDANAQCRSSSVGTQFCATSELTTFVHRGLGDIN